MEPVFGILFAFKELTVALVMDVGCRSNPALAFFAFIDASLAIGPSLLISTSYLIYLVLL